MSAKCLRCGAGGEWLQGLPRYHDYDTAFDEIVAERDRLERELAEVNALFSGIGDACNELSDCAETWNGTSISSVDYRLYEEIVRIRDLFDPAYEHHMKIDALKENPCSL